MFDKIKGFFMKLFNWKHIEDITGIKINISPAMKEAIELWSAIWSGKAEWHKTYPSCGVMENIAGMLSTVVGEEIEIASENEALQDILQHINENNHVIVQYMVGMGSALVRPVFSNAKVQYEIVPLGKYLPTRYDFDGTLTGAVITKQFIESGKKILLVENHTYENKRHTVQTDVYEISGEALKKRNLTDFAQTKDITPLYVWENVDAPFIVEFRNRFVNRIDGSQVPVSMVAGNENLIEDADKQYARLNWEQQGGELKVFADEDLFSKRQGRDGEENTVHIDSELKKLFVKFHGDTQEGAAKIHTHAPQLRTEQQIAAFQQILKRIELAMNVGKGTLSDLEQVQQTATQFTGGKKAFYSIVDTIESELEKKFKLCAYVFAYMTSAFTGAAFNPDISIEFNDMTRKDPMQMKQTAMQEVAAGLMNKWEYRVQFFGEDEATAKANTPEPIMPTFPM